MKIVHLKNDIADSIIRKSTIYYLFNDIKKYYNKYQEKPENNNSGIFKIQAEGLKLQYKQVEKLNAVVKALVFKDNI